MGVARAAVKFVTNIGSTLILGEVALAKFTRLLATKILPPHRTLHTKAAVEEDICHARGGMLTTMTRVVGGREVETLIIANADANQMTKNKTSRVAGDEGAETMALIVIERMGGWCGAEGG
mmetsp:Transcript_36230/g.53146  ORF Transcript_36230/g.53146 Transcript_36230/m.53146 type:complete len:121 (-) Transcript_36230:69-431(-)